MNTSFVNFYSKHGISPVRQDISDIKKHFQRRESLYKHLGIFPASLNGKAVIEFGCGSGFNAVYTANLTPSRYVLVDGNKRGIEDSKNNLRSSGVSLSNIEFICTLFQGYRTKEKFDFVFAEACIPHQEDPISILEHITSFVRPGGVLVLTTASGVSYLSETIRRLVRDVCLTPYETPAKQLEVIGPLLIPHLDTLKGMSRYKKDWLLDNIIQPLYKVKLFSIPEAVDALASSFDVYSTSPRFVTDWRWYKDIIGKNRGFNELAIDAYYKNSLNFLDYRFVFSQHRREFGEELEAKCAKAWDLMCRLESAAMTSWDPIWKLLEEIHAMIFENAPETAMALREAIDWLQDGAKETNLQHFPEWWGRGQQYVSFIRRPE